MKQEPDDQGLTQYPGNWPRCPVCGDYALDGHLTCGRTGCDEAGQRELARGAAPWWMQDVRCAQRAIEAERARRRAARESGSSDAETGFGENCGPKL